MVESYHSPYTLLEAECRALLLPHVPEGTVVRFERPPNPDLGDLACPVALQLSRELKRAPMAIAEQIVGALDLGQTTLVREVRVARPGFINFYVHQDRFTRLVLDTAQASGAAYGRPFGVQPRHVVIEHTSVNPNKPWHIGHVRNAALGDVLGRLFRFVGHDVEIQNYIDDTGKQVADMLFGLHYSGLLGPNGSVSFPANQKPDHFVGEAYVKINALAKAGTVDAAQVDAGSATFMHAREEGQYRDLVHTIVYAQLATAWRLGIFYDLLTWEGDIVQAHLFEEAMTRLRAAPTVFLQTEGRHAGCLVIEMGEFLPEGAGELAEDHPTERVLIRSNGLPTYTAKDIAYHMWKYGLLSRDLLYKLDAVQPNGKDLWTSAPDGAPRPHPPAGEVINLIDVRQSLPQQVVKAALAVTGYAKEAATHHHLAYGFVSPKGGRFSGREGTELTADSVLDAVVEAQFARASEKAQERGVDVPEAELRATSEVVAVGALRYLMCRFDPLKNITFTIEDVLDEKGTTGLYIQYAYARVQSIFRKGGYADVSYAAGQAPWDGADAALLTHVREQALVRLIARLPQVIEQVLEQLTVHILADYAHELAETFSLFYEACPILRSDVAPELRMARLALAATIAQTMRTGAAVLGIDLPERL